MVDYDLSSDARVALRRAKKRTTIGGALILLSAAAPILIQLRYLVVRQEIDSVSGITITAEPAGTRTFLIAAGITGLLAGIYFIATGLRDEARAERIAKGSRMTGKAKPNQLT